MNSVISKLPQRFVCVKLDENGKKKPFNPRTGSDLMWKDSSTWMAYDDAMRWNPPFVGFVLLEDDPLIAIDLDDCGPDWNADALQIHANFQGAAVEVSSSGKGLHIIASCPRKFMLPLGDAKNPVWFTPSGQKIEVFTGNKVLTLGRFGDSLQGDPLADCTAALARLLASAPPRPARAAPGALAGSCPVDDTAVKTRLLSSRGSAAAAFGDAPSRDDLWNARADVMARWRPATGRADGLPYDASAADGALAMHLAYLTHRDPVVMERLFGESTLGKREKWTSRPDYRRDTIESAIAACDRVADWTPKPTTPAVPSTDMDIAQLAMAETLEREANGRLRYTTAKGCWHVWNGNMWADGDLVENAVYQLAGEVARRTAANAGASEGQRRAALSESSLKAVVKLTARQRSIATTPDAWDRHPHLIGTPGGTVDLRTGVLRMADPADGITRSLSIAPDPAHACPLWSNLINHICGGDAATVDFLRRWVGYSLTGETTEQALLYIYGASKSGKSTFVETLARIVSGYGANIGLETLLRKRAERHLAEFARLDGPRLLYASETTEGRTWDDGIVKRLTGGDAITANFMRENHFTFRPKFKLTIVGNDLPSLAVVDDALKRRFHILHVEHSAPFRDNRLSEKLDAEAPGILAWAISGAVDWYRSGLAVPHAVHKATGEYFEEQDDFSRWIAECCDLGPDLWDSSQSLFQSWEHFCRVTGIDNDVSKNKGFASRLRSRKLTLHRTNTSRGWKGIRARPPFYLSPVTVPVTAPPTVSH